MADTSDDILDNALKPKRASGDAGSVEQHSIPDQIAADRYKRATAAAKKGLGLKFLKIVPGAAHDVNRNDQ